MWVLMGLVALLLMSFQQTTGLEIPFKRIEKDLAKLMKNQPVKLIAQTAFDSCSNGASWFGIEQEGKTTSYVLVNRVESCRAGGCDASLPFDQQPFEFFDYYMVLSSQGEVLLVRIYNYQATRGHEVMSKGWLKQFVGVLPHQKLEVGEDIQAISGATISSKAIAADIALQTSYLDYYLVDPLMQK